MDTHRRPSPWPLVATLLLLSAPQLADARAPGDDPDTVLPSWAHTKLQEQVGRWVVAAPAEEANDSYDGYGMEWEWGLGEKTLVGRLFARKGDRDLRTMWEYRIFWHAGEQALMMYQWGNDGSLGTGIIESRDGGGSRADQTFWNPDGSTFRIGHEDWVENDRRHTNSFTIDEAGDWKPLRGYVWERDR